MKRIQKTKTDYTAPELAKIILLSAQQDKLSLEDVKKLAMVCHDCIVFMKLGITGSIMDVYFRHFF